jgi:hypothetical protein
MIKTTKLAEKKPEEKVALAAPVLVKPSKYQAKPAEANRP